MALLYFVSSLPLQFAGPVTVKTSRCVQQLRPQPRYGMCATQSQNGSYEGVRGKDPPFLEYCTTCDRTGFVPCTNCNATGVVKSPNSVNVFYCSKCVGHKKLRCPACGGKCYMCD